MKVLIVDINESSHFYSSIRCTHLNDLFSISQEIIEQCDRILLVDGLTKEFKVLKDRVGKYTVGKIENLKFLKQYLN